MSIPYMNLYVVDFDADTAHLTLEEDGAYNRLLRLCWRTPGCSIPADDQWIMRRMRVNQDDYERVVKPVLDEFFKVKSGRIFNKRQTEEFSDAKSRRESAVKKGKKGGRPRKPLKNKETGESSGYSQLKLGESTPTPTPTREDEEEDAGANARVSEPLSDPPSAPKTGASFFEQVLHAAGADRGRLGRHWMPPASEMEINRWRRDLGLTEAEILSVIAESRKRHDEPAAGPKAFQRDMAALAGAKTAPRLIPINGGNHGTEPSSPARRRFGGITEHDLHRTAEMGRRLGERYRGGHAEPDADDE